MGEIDAMWTEVRHSHKRWNLYQCMNIGMQQNDFHFLKGWENALYFGMVNIVSLADKPLGCLWRIFTLVN